MTGDDPLTQMRAKAVQRTAEGPPEQPTAVELMTLRQALDLNERRLKNKKKAPRTIEWYRVTVEKYLGDWLGRPLNGLTGAMLRQRHEEISTRHGPYIANGTMRALSAIWNTWAAQDEDTLRKFPRKTILWHEEGRRPAVLTKEVLPRWYAECMALPNPVRRDWYRLALFSGLRALTLNTIHERDIDLERRTLLIPRPKGGEARAFTIPLSPIMVEIIRGRLDGNPAFWEGLKRKALSDPADRDWLFPSHGPTGHITQPRPNRRDPFTVQFIPHNLRAAYISAAAAAGVNAYHIKWLVNHAMPKGDVTGGYTENDVEALRGSQDRISAELIARCQIGEAAHVAEQVG